MFQDPTFWVAVAFFCLVGATVYWGRPQLLNLVKSLDDQSKKIQSQILDAEELYNKTLKAHEDAKASVVDAKSQAREILEHTKVEIDHYRSQSEETLRKLSEQFDSKIATRLDRGRAQALDDLQKTVSSLVVRATQEVLQKVAEDPNNQALITEASLKDIHKAAGN